MHSLCCARSRSELLRRRHGDVMHHDVVAARHRHGVADTWKTHDMCHVYPTMVMVHLFLKKPIRRLFQRFAKRAIWWRFSQKSPDFLANLIVTAARSPGRADPPFLDMELLGSVPPAGLQMAKIPNYFGFTKRYFWTPQKSRYFWYFQFWLHVNQSWKCMNFYVKLYKFLCTLHIASMRDRHTAPDERERFVRWRVLLKTTRNLLSSENREQIRSSFKRNGTGMRYDFTV